MEKQIDAYLIFMTLGNYIGRSYLSLIINIDNIGKKKLYI